MEFEFSNPSGKNWNIFEISSGSTLELATGVASDGTLKMVVSGKKSGTPSVFILEPNAKLILEKGTIVEFHYPSNASVNMFVMNGKPWELPTEQYPGLRLEEETGTTTNITRLVVVETTVIQGTSN